MESNESADDRSAQDPVAPAPPGPDPAPPAVEPSSLAPPAVEPPVEEQQTPAPPEPPPVAAPAPPVAQPIPETTPAIHEQVIPPPISPDPAAAEPLAGESTEPEPPPAGRRRLPSLRATVIVLLVVAVVVESVLLFRSGSDERARMEVFDISRRFLSTLTTYSTSTIDEQRRRVLALATGRFRTEFTQLTGPEFVAALRERQADSKGSVTRLAVTSIEGENAQVMGVVEVSVTNKDLPAPSVERNVIELSLVRTGSGWRIDAVSILGTLP